MLIKLVESRNKCGVRQVIMAAKRLMWITLKDRIKDSEDALTKGLKFDANSGGVKLINLALRLPLRAKVMMLMLTTAVKTLKLSYTRSRWQHNYRCEDEQKTSKLIVWPLPVKMVKTAFTIKGGDAKNGVDGTSINRLVTEDKDGIIRLQPLTMV